MCCRCIKVVFPGHNHENTYSTNLDSASTVSEDVPRETTTAATLPCHLKRVDQVTACLLTQSRSGAKNNPRSHLHQAIAPARTEYGGILRSATVSSKLTSGKWPHPGAVARKVIRTLRDWGALHHSGSSPTRAAAFAGRAGFASKLKPSTAPAGVAMTVTGAAPARDTAGTAQGKEGDAQQQGNDGGHFVRDAVSPVVHADEELAKTPQPNVQLLVAGEPGSRSGAPVPSRAGSQGGAGSGGESYSVGRHPTGTSEVVEHHSGQRGGYHLNGDGQRSSDSVLSATSQACHPREEVGNGRGNENTSRGGGQCEVLPTEAFSIVVGDVVVEVRVIERVGNEKTL